eukprot:CAMPEP_0182464214 /NCGR_PEP_ID=MMETSP1319-20130603/8400_1 /TAXON_ID=172717 /ORGANISM="Bolidomonas pacifica, Strain RCC208" /LENGTH=144 /DNA_ID=CAMNT_0024663841 /DNA_START=180 /DNA_END=611 /DNA_ORIENTATION=+
METPPPTYLSLPSVLSLLSSPSCSSPSPPPSSQDPLPPPPDPYTLLDVLYRLRTPHGYSAARAREYKESGAVPNGPGLVEKATSEPAQVAGWLVELLSSSSSSSSSGHGLGDSRRPDEGASNFDDVALGHSLLPTALPLQTFFH